MDADLADFLDGVTVTYWEDGEARAIFERYFLIPLAPAWELAPIVP